MRFKKKKDTMTETKKGQRQETIIKDIYTPIKKKNVFYSDKKLMFEKVLDHFQKRKKHDDLGPTQEFRKKCNCALLKVGFLSSKPDRIYI